MLTKVSSHNKIYVKIPPRMLNTAENERDKKGGGREKKLKSGKNSNRNVC